MSDASHASDMNGSLRYYIPSKSSKKEADDRRLYLMFIATAIRDYTTEAFVLSFMQTPHQPLPNPPLPSLLSFSSKT